MFYLILTMLMIAVGLMLSRYELVKAKRERRERLKQRARRCV